MLSKTTVKTVANIPLTEQIKPYSMVCLHCPPCMTFGNFRWDDFSPYN